MNLLGQIICSEFRKAFQPDGVASLKDKAMLMTFRLTVDHAREDGYRNLKMLIFGGGSNYISVFAKLDWTVVPVEALEDEDGLKPGFDYTTGETPWVHFSCHDSCWTSDGVENILFLFRKRINILDMHHGRWYEEVSLSADEIKSFQSITSETRNSRAPHAHDFQALEFHFPENALAE